MGTTHTQWKYLERDPKSSYRQLSIKGRRIKARTLYGQFMSAEEPRTVEQIAEDYQLPIEAVKEAITYCQGDPPEIEKDAAEEDAIMELLGMNESRYKDNPRPRQVDPAEILRIRRSIGE